ncbi:sporulation protein YqfC [Alteribacillus sp. HJP-4]|uniref:sporulation protein YqfC n=1 Tax=Alteribacillus sp. HJP-4 TaxID=2775394 RepID=UPI0035CD005B
MLKRWRQSAKKWITGSMDLPADVLLDVPRITMVGQLHLHIENHRGLIHFSNAHVRLKISTGELGIEGSGFIIKTILPNELLLEGNIEKIEYLGRTSKGG